ncbi:MAG: c-type cytochrome [Dehalococcoidia bacterium]
MSEAPHKSRTAEETSYALPFLVCSLLLIATSVWALWDEVIGRRPWKWYQQAYYQLKTERIRAELEAARARLTDPATRRKHQDLQSSLRTARERLASPEAQREDRRLQKERQRVKERLRKAALARRVAHARFQEEEYLLGRSGDERHLAQMQRYSREREEATSEEKDLQVELGSVEKELAALTGDVDRLRGKLEELPALLRVEALERLLEEARYPEIEIVQDHIPELNQVDRCRSCHVGIEDRVPVSDEHPFAPHPGSRVFLRNHPPGRFGCTVCHRGQGRATSSAEKAHGRVEHWTTPMLEAQMTQATCQKCHQRLGGLRGAERASQGEEAVRKFGCYGCHKIAGYENLRKVGPPLGEVGKKVNYSWIVRWLRDPQAVIPSARMPNFGLSEREIVAVTDYLYSLSSNRRKDLPVGEVNWDLYDKGKVLWSQSRCSLCHLANGLGGAHEAVHAPELSTVGSKVGREWLSGWLDRPKDYFPGALMPRFRFTEPQRRALAEYLRGEFVDWDFEDEVQEQAASGVIPAESIRQGAEVIKKYGCFGCHDITGMEDMQKIGPYLRQSELEEPVAAGLSAIGSKPVQQLFFGRLSDVDHDRQTYLATKLRTPRAFQEGLRMPKFPLSEEQIASLTTLLMGFTPAEIDTMPAQFRVPHPEPHYEPTGGFAAIVADVDCLVCHTINGAGLPFARTSPSRGAESSRTGSGAS